MDCWRRFLLPGPTRKRWGKRATLAQAARSQIEPRPLPLFVYGSLMFNEVWCQVTRRCPRATPAQLSGFRRYSVIGEDYPALLPETGHRPVQGLLRDDLSTRTLQQLDRFEGDCYRRMKVWVRLEDGTFLRAWTYVFRRRFAAVISREPWDPRHFARSGLRRFMSRYQGFN